MIRVVDARELDALVHEPETPAPQLPWLLIVPLALLGWVPLIGLAYGCALVLS